MKRGRPKKKPAMESCVKSISKQERKDLRTLADDFHLLHMEKVQETIDSCQSYAEGQRAIMRIYTTVYM